MGTPRIVVVWRRDGLGGRVGVSGVSKSLGLAAEFGDLLLPAAYAGKCCRPIGRAGFISQQNPGRIGET